MFTEFNTERCKVSIFNKYDAINLHKIIEDNYEHLKEFINKMDDEPLTLKDRYIYVENCQNNFINQYAVRYNDEIIGSFGIEHGNAEFVSFNYWIVENYSNMGIISEVVDEAISLVFKFGINKIRIACNKENIYSRKIAEKFNFKLIEVKEHMDFKNPRKLFQLMIWELKGDEHDRKRE